jgi:predicted porin
VSLPRVVLLAALVLCVLLWPAPGRAQPAGYYAAPSLTLAGVFDDNVFLTSAHREADFILRLTPAISAGYRSAPLTILGNYAFDVEKYAVNEDLDNVADRQLGGIELKYLPESRLTLALTAAYAKTNRPVELSRQAGLQPITRVERGFEEATAFTVSPSVTYQFTPLWSGIAGYSYSLLEAEGGASTTTHAVTLGMARRLTAKDTGSLRYLVRRFEDDTGTTETTHALIAGWTRRLTEFTTATVEAGPRFSGGDVDAEVLASLQYRFKFTDVLLAYSRTVAVTPGQSGTAVTDTVTGQASFKPLKFLQVSVGPSVQRSSSATASGPSSETIYYYSVSASATYQINKWLSARAAYAWSLQEGGGQDILHNLFSVGLTAIYPLRID